MWNILFHWMKRDRECNSRDKIERIYFPKVFDDFQIENVEKTYVISFLRKATSIERMKSIALLISSGFKRQLMPIDECKFSELWMKHTKLEINWRKFHSGYWIVVGILAGTLQQFRWFALLLNLSLRSSFCWWWKKWFVYLPSTIMKQYIFCYGYYWRCILICFSSDPFTTTSF